MRIEEIRPNHLVEEQRAAYLADVDYYRSKIDNFESRNCPGCGSESGKYFCQHLDFSFDRCNACFTVFMNPGPTQAIVDSLYANSVNYLFWSQKMYPETRLARRNGLHKNRADFLLEQIKILEPTLPLNILELGAGTGDSLSVLKETSNRLLNCYAIEPNPSMEESLQSNNIEVFRSYREAQEKQYDVLVAYEVVEHILDPITFLSEYGKLLRVGGLFVISTPNAHSIEVQLLKSESITLDIEHISVITPAAVHSLAARSGMKVLRIETPGEFDLELISKAENYANWGCGLTQNEVREFNFSSHMKIVLEKISD